MPHFWVRFYHAPGSIARHDAVAYYGRGAEYAGSKFISKRKSLGSGGGSSDGSTDDAAHATGLVCRGGIYSHAFWRWLGCDRRSISTRRATVSEPMKPWLNDHCLWKFACLRKSTARGELVMGIARSPITFHALNTDFCRETRCACMLELFPSSLRPSSAPVGRDADMTRILQQLGKTLINGFYLDAASNLGL